MYILGAAFIAMHLTARELRQTDFNGMFRLCFPEHDEQSNRYRIERQRWDLIWQHVRPEGAAVVNMASPRSPLCAIMMGVFVRSEVAARLRDMPCPHLMHHFSEQIRAGERVFENEEDYGRRNAGEGLEILVCYLGWEGQDYFAPENAMLRAYVSNAFAERVSGHRIRCLFGEIWGEEQLMMAKRVGLEIYNDYAGCSAGAEIPRHLTPVVVGMTPESAIESENHVMMKIFTYLPPTFHFTDGQREVLNLAMAGQTDADIAELLGVSQDAVKVRWKAIYERVERFMPGLLPESGEGARGIEKRRALLGHLRGRPEELRPYEP